MKRGLILTSVLVLGVATVAMAAPPQVSGLANLSRGPLAGTLLGKVVSGSLGRLMVLRSELGVTNEQRGQIRDIVVSHRSEIATNVKSVRDKRLALRDTVRAEAPQEMAIRAAAQELGDAIADASVQRSKLRAEIAPILTSEQHDLIDQFLADNHQAIDTFLVQAAQK